jgi:hypothetical protein
MRTSNIVVTVLGLLGAAVGGWMAWRWRNLVAPTEPAPQTPGGHAAAAVRRCLLKMTAGAIAGVLVLGLGGRLVMRVLAATSGDGAQGRLTEADEVVGRITNGGTVGFVVFTGFFGGLVAALIHLVAGRWLPRRASGLGAVLAVILVGSFGVTDPLSPDNVDFAVLEPLWLAAVLVLACGVLFAMAYAALVIRLDHWVREDGARQLVFVASAPMMLVVVPAIVVVLDAVGCAIAQGRVAAALDRRRPLLAGHAVVAAATVAMAFTSAVAVVRILA